VAPVPPWNICKDLLGRAQNGEFDHATDSTRDGVVSELVGTCSWTVAAYALQPFPGVDSAIVAPIHRQMIETVARIYGYRVDGRVISKRILGPLRSRILIHHAAMVAAKVVPFVDILAVAVAYALTCGIGEVSKAFFRRGGAMRKREMRARFDAVYAQAHERAFKEKRNELRAMFSNRKVQSEIRDLKKAARDGKLAIGEVERRIEEVLSRG
jgi:uncharacterized protein (DUF697 family)